MAGKKRNVIVINADSFRRDNLSVHGGAAVRSPNLDALARTSVVFENVYAGSYPTIPNRADVFLGT
jgi:arylsulfatase A-like enzyme